MIRNARPPAWIGPRGIGFVLVLACAGGLLATRLTWIVALAVVVVLLVAALAIDGGLLRTRLEVMRTIPAHLALARRDVFTYTIANRASVGRRFAIFESPVARLAIALAPARGFVAPRARTEATIAFVPRERGHTTIDTTFVWYESPLGLVRRRIVLDERVPVRVLPDLSALESGDLSQRVRMLDAGLRRLRRRGVGTEFESLREYASGDAFRAIDWKATARRGKVMVAQYEVERRQQIVVAIDAGRLMSPRLGDRRKLDYAVSAALAISSMAQLADDRVALQAFADRALVTVPAGNGPAHTAKLTDALSDLEPHFVEADYERAALDIRARFRRRSLIVVFTDLFDPVASGAVLASLALLVPHHLVLVVLMNDAAITDALDREPSERGDAYRAAVATTLAAERRRAVALLGERGIGVIDVPAAELSIALLDAYVEIKTRALL
jgi:uncharacterized protein (DUF58 family)